MYYPNSFYKATDEYNTYEKHVNAPYIRHIFNTPVFDKAYITISALGFYDLYINGEKITKGLLAPYISNPDHTVYFDKYDVTTLLKKNNNVIGIILGNGIQNAPGGKVWDFDKASFRNSPCFAASITYIDKNNNMTHIDANEAFKTYPSPIIFDDLRSGCFYDANLEINDWLTPEYDDSKWSNVKKATIPKGEFRVCEADPILITEEIKATEIKEAVLDSRLNNLEIMRLDTQFKFNKRGQKGTLFDFGVNTAGLFRLRINGNKGQQIFIQFCEYITQNGEPSYTSTGSFYPDGYGQTAYYICNGKNNEEFIPSFTYYGYRYAMVFGLEDNQISENTLVMLKANSNLVSRASFNCSDETMNLLGKMSNTSDLANFYYFPTDCPHREKNGWTGDAAVSAERMLLTLSPENSYKEWLRNICKAQLSDGQLPGIVPTSGWGYAWGNGPAWDNVLSELCWQTNRFRGDLSLAKDCADSMMKYLLYIENKRRDDGLIEIGLGDWLQPLKPDDCPTAPRYLTDSVISMYICYKSAELFKLLDITSNATYATSLYNSFRDSIRNNCIDFSSMKVVSDCQTAQAICLYYNVFNQDEKEKAYQVLLELVHEKDDHFDCGMIGMRVIFHTLSDCGHSDLAFKMITRKDFPSYGMFVERGLTSLAEDFLPDSELDNPKSLNHHFMGDITSWFIQRIVGIRVNPRCISPNDFDISPNFIESLDFAEAHYDAPCGKIYVKWEKKDNNISLNIIVPNNATGKIILPIDYCFTDNNYQNTTLKSGCYLISKK